MEERTRLRSLQYGCATASLLARGPRARPFRKFSSARHLGRGLNRAGVAVFVWLPASIFALHDELHLFPFHRTGDFVLALITGQLLALLFEDERQWGGSHASFQSN